MAVSGNERTDALLADKDWKVRRKAVLDVGYRRDAERYGNLVEALDDPDVAVRQAAILSLGRLVRPGVVDELTKPKILLADDARIRSAAISTLGEIGGIRILDAVSQCLSDPEWTVRAEATVVVSRLIDQVCEVRIPETARVLVRMLPIDDPDIRERTIEALGSFGKVAVNVLADALDMKSERVRSGAAAALGLIRDPATVYALVALLSDDSVQVRLSAITALGNLHSARAVAPLVDRLSDPDSRIRTATIDSLQRIGQAAVEPLVEALELAGTDIETTAIIRALGGFGDERAVVHIMNCLGHTYMTARQAAIEAAVAYGDRAVPSLVEMLVLSKVPVEPLVEDALKNRQKRNRLRTIRALGELKDSQAVPALKRIGQEGDRQVREEVEESLRKIGSATWARASAAEALGRIGGVEAVPALLRSLGDPNSTVRLRAVRALAEIGDVSASSRLATLVSREDDAEVREEAVSALGRLGVGSRTAERACIRALSDASRSVRSQAAKALGRLASPHAAPPLVRALGDSYWSVRRDAENSLTNLGRRAVPALIASLESRRSAARLRAARILGAIGDDRAVRPLKKLLKSEKDGQVSDVAAEALSALTDST